MGNPRLGFMPERMSKKLSADDLDMWKVLFPEVLKLVRRNQNKESWDGVLSEMLKAAKKAVRIEKKAWFCCVSHDAYGHASASLLHLFAATDDANKSLIPMMEEVESNGCKRRDVRRVFKRILKNKDLFKACYVLVF